MDNFLTKQPQALQFFSTPSMTLEELAKYADGARATRGIYYQVSLQKRVFKTDKDGDKVCILGYVVAAQGHQYMVILEALANPKPDEPIRLKVYCGCKDALYRTCYGLNKMGMWYRSPATDAKCSKALTTPPSVVTPTLICKHICEAIYQLGKNTRLLYENG